MSRRQQPFDFGDIGSSEDFLAAIDKTIRYFNDGDLVWGTVVKVDSDKVLLDIGYKTDGVIPANELSFEFYVDPQDVVNVGDHVEALVLQVDDEEGRPVLSRTRAQQARESEEEPDELRKRLADNERENKKELDELRKRLAGDQKELDKLRKQLADDEKELDKLRKQVADNEGELDELRAAADRYMGEGREAKAVARSLWSAMPPEGRVAYFEADCSWLPEWVVGRNAD